jgi:hypothetical protein
MTAEGGRRHVWRATLLLCAAAVAVVCACAAFVSPRWAGAAELEQVSFDDVSAQRRVARQARTAPGSVSFTDLSALRRWSGRGSQLSARGAGLAATTSLASTSGDPIPVGQVIHVNVPKSALKSLKVGSEIKGRVNKQMLRQDGTEAVNAVDFVGKVRSLQMITVQGKVQSNIMGEPDEGVVSVKLMSDHYVAPGTPVTGMVAGKIFKGVVTTAPSIEDRMDEAEKRLRELAPPVCDEICKLEKEIELTQKRIDDFKASRKLRKMSEKLEKRVDKLANPPPPPEKVAILGNWAGFKFNLPDGPDIFGPRISKMTERLDSIPKEYSDIMAPLYKATQKLEKKLDKVEGLKTYRQRVTRMQYELDEMERCIAEADGDKKEAAPCIREVMASTKFKTFHNLEAMEEHEKERGPGAPPLGEEQEFEEDDFPPPKEEEEGGEEGEEEGGEEEGGEEEAGEEEAGEKGEEEGASEESESEGESEEEAQAGEEGQEGGADEDATAKEEADERRAEGEPAASEDVPLEEEAKKARVQALRSQVSKARKSKSASKWAPGQKKTWEKFLKKTDKMDGIANDEDNIISQWA